MALPVLNVYHLEGLLAHLANVDTPAILAVHGVASLSEALEIYSLVDTASRERGWEVQALPNLARLAGVATGFQNLATTIIPSLIADPFSKEDLVMLRNLALSVRHHARRLDCAGIMRVRVAPLANRLLRMAQRVISGQEVAASLSEQLPAVAVQLGHLMEVCYIPIDQGPPPRIDINNLDALLTALNTTDGRVEVVVHAVASLTEALGMYDNAAAAVRDREWIMPRLPDLAHLAALAVEVDRLITDLLPLVIADPSTTRNLFALKNAASTVRKQARRVDSGGEFRRHLDTLMTRILGAVRQVISGQAAPPLLGEVLPAARDELNVCASTEYIALP